MREIDTTEFRQRFHMPLATQKWWRDHGLLVEGVHWRRTAGGTILYDPAALERHDRLADYAARRQRRG